MIKFLLDSGDPLEYKSLLELAKTNSQELWGATTNPTLIAKKLAGKKVSRQDAFSTLQKEIIDEILTLVPGAVSAEVFSDEKTTADEMIAQGKEIASWDPRVVVKLPTTIEGLRARATLRKMGVLINNTLVFSQEQIFAILLQEKLLSETNLPKHQFGWSPFISPFVGRLDDKGENGMDVIEHGIALQNEYFTPETCWILESSVRNTIQVKKGLTLEVAMMTVRFSVLQEWFSLSQEQKSIVPLEPTEPLAPIKKWVPSESLLSISSLDAYFEAIEKGSLNISHPLTTAGIERFVSDWSTILL